MGYRGNWDEGLLRANETNDGGFQFDLGKWGNNVETSWDPGGGRNWDEVLLRPRKTKDRGSPFDIHFVNEGIWRPVGVEGKLGRGTFEGAGNQG